MQGVSRSFHKLSLMDFLLKFSLRELFCIWPWYTLSYSYPGWSYISDFAGGWHFPQVSEGSRKFILKYEFHWKSGIHIRSDKWGYNSSKNWGPNTHLMSGGKWGREKSCCIFGQTENESSVDKCKGLTFPACTEIFAKSFEIFRPNAPFMSSG